ncbi:unnamed protein product [Prunus armeniaca]
MSKELGDIWLWSPLALYVVGTMKISFTLLGIVGVLRRYGLLFCLQVNSMVFSYLIFLLGFGAISFLKLSGKGGPLGIPCLFSLVGMYGSGVTNTFLMMLRSCLVILGRLFVLLFWIGLRLQSVNCRNVPRTQVMLRWEPPRSGWVKLNVDGTCMNASGKIGACGVIRDCFREWCGGSAMNLGKGRILDAEIWGLLFGLRLAVAKGFTKILIEMDSQIAVNLFQQRDSLCFHPLAALLSNCEKMLMQFESWNIQHIFKEKNGLADCLAKWGHNLDLDIQFFVSTPIWASFVLADDLLGVT